jgi:hypothetical protein
MQEESNEDEEPNTEPGAKQRGYWDAANKHNLDKLNDKKSYNEDLGGKSDCIDLGMDSLDGRLEDSMDLQACKEIF